MSLIRFAGRLLYSGYFVANGVALLTKPDEYADDIAQTTDKVVPTVQSFLPDDAADALPEDAHSWARILGLAQIVGGACYALGFARRPAALLLGLTTVPQIVTAATSETKSKALAPLALAGAALVATQDTAGKPSLAWRAGKAAEKVTKTADNSGSKFVDSVRDSAKEFKKEAKKVATQARKDAKKAAAKGSDLAKDVLN